jgi:hypothetical protein
VSNIVRWFEEFPSRALELLPSMKHLAADRDRVGSLSLLIAPALIVAPLERLQTRGPRKNPQRDYERFPDARIQFDRVMETPFRDVEFWTVATKSSVADWRRSQVEEITPDSTRWRTASGLKPWEKDFWSVDSGAEKTIWVLKLLRDALSHWNVANADDRHRVFDESAIMQRFLFYRSHKERGPWDVVSVSPEAFLVFLEAWTEFLSRGCAREVLAASQAA